MEKRYKQNFLADSGYHSSKNKTYLKNLGYNPIIKYNKRNTQNPNIIKDNELTIDEKNIYKRRPIIEATFSWIKNYPTINQNYQKH
jgi:Transposase DDE domain